MTEICNYHVLNDMNKFLQKYLANIIFIKSERPLYFISKSSLTSVQKNSKQVFNDVATHAIVLSLVLEKNVHNLNIIKKIKHVMVSSL